ncbi:MAG TPA: nucleoside diphosphate kinase regulator [Terriglobales bacterium]|nr:nucleoside diphosphate kinase regulator [Terriglobales bacterium]
MPSYNIFITQPDLEQLSQMVDSVRKAVGTEPGTLQMLETELDRAVILSPFVIPPDVVTMHSRVRVRDLSANQDSTYTLVFPRDADFKQGKISVLAPVGTAILGSRVGDVIEWKVPGGIRKLRIEEVLYQPERAGRVASILRALHDEHAPTRDREIALESPRLARAFV